MCPRESEESPDGPPGSAFVLFSACSGKTERTFKESVTQPLCRKMKFFQIVQNWGLTIIDCLAYVRLKRRATTDKVFL